MIYVHLYILYNIYYLLRFYYLQSINWLCSVFTKFKNILSDAKMSENSNIDLVKNDPSILRLKKETNLENLSKEELISKVVSLEKHIKQLR